MKPACICNEIFKVDHSACESGTSYLCKQLADTKSTRFTLNGKQISREEASDSVCRMLSDARYPLITGLNLLGSQALRTAVSIARNCRAVVDTGIGRSVAVSSMVREGQITATIGEIVSRADRIVLVECCPERTHPRLNAKLQESEVAIEFSSIAHANSGCSPSMPLSYNLNSVCVESDLMQLRTLLQQNKLDPDSATDNGELKGLLDWLLAGEYVAMLTGQIGSSCMDTVTAICKELNQHVKAVTLQLDVDANSIGAENILAATAGFPRAVDFSQGYARSFANEFGSEVILSASESDLLVTFDPAIAQSAPPDLAKVVFCLPGFQFEPADRSLDQSLLLIEGLHSLGDEFHRLDHLPFEVKNPSSETSTIGSFLGQILGTLI